MLRVSVFQRLFNVNTRLIVIGRFFPLLYKYVDKILYCRFTTTKFHYFKKLFVRNTV